MFDTYLITIIVIVVIILSSAIRILREYERGVIITAVVVTALFFAFAISLGLKAQSRKVTTGQKGLIGEAGRAHTDLDPTGTVAIHGEFWKAESATGETIEAGTRVEIIEVAGLEILVRPAAASPFNTGRDQNQASD